MSLFAGRAERLGIDHEIIPLHANGPKRWCCLETGPWSGVEDAALAHYQSQGWEGANSEGGLMLTLIKAASFDPLSPRNANTFVEALYAQNVSFPEDKFEPDQLIETILGATLGRLERNWAVISRDAGETPYFFPSVRWHHIASLFQTLGPERLAAIARIFARAPYDYRAGWPDLTLWRDGQVRFVEVKAPGDRLHASQVRLMSELLLPLGYKPGLAEVVELHS